MLECPNCYLDLPESDYWYHLKECSYSDYLDLRLEIINDPEPEPEDGAIWIWWQKL